MDYTIAITTFSLRYEMLENLIRQIRFFTDRTILICINGEKNGTFSEDYRLRVLRLCTMVPKVYPIFFVEMRGLSKMWNTLLIHSDKDNVLMLNDDILIVQNIFEDIKKYINTEDYKGLTLLNSSFSHFIANRTLIDKLGFFDERLLGFGEEDGDIVYRLNKYNENNNNVPIVWVNGLHNIISEIRQTAVKKGSINNVEHKYSDFNRKFVYGEKYSADETSTYKGFFDTYMRENLENKNLYPYESFFWENKDKLFN